MSDSFEDDEEEVYDEILDQQIQRLTIMARFARTVIDTPWFSRIGAPLSIEDTATATAYLSAAGFPDATVAQVEGWDEAVSVAENPNWNSDWWEAEEQLKSGLIVQSLDLVDESELANALNHLSAQCAGVAVEAISNAAIDAGFQPESDEESFLNAAAGWAVAGAYQAALVLAAGAEGDHPFALKFRLFETGRLPFGVVGATFSIF
ncbi:MAG: hypothetical protein OTJ45_05215 [Alphaproteobacteria bacterium]|nr:hypothetical protein [Alphaproteobacteria bacterium]